MEDVDNTDEEITWKYSGSTELLVEITDRVATVTIPDGDWNGSETITFTATDPELLSDSDDLIFTITAVNDAPILDPIGVQSVDEGQLLTFTVSASDPADDDVLLNESSLSQGAVFNPLNGLFEWTPGYYQAGTYMDVHFEITDGFLSDSEDITITENPVNRNLPPSVDADLDQSITIPDEANLSGTADDRDGNKSWEVAINSKNDGVLKGVAIDPMTEDSNDDIIVVVGHYTNYVGGSTGKDWLIRMYDQEDNGQSSNPLWATRVGGMGEDIAYDVAVDSTGNVVIVGVIEDLANGSGEDWVTYSFSRAGEDVANSVAVDPTSGAVYIGGYGTDLIDDSSGKDAWLKYFNENGGELLDKNIFGE